jgi:tetratricopeptide (TPR) repeat protein
VSEESQRRALDLFREGNVYFEQSKYTEAVALYEQALSSWDHPNIRFNMAICLINMRQPLVAWTHLQQALRFGEAPLGKQHHIDALSYVAVLESSLAQITVKATQPDIKVMLDGARVLDGPGTYTSKLLPGKHQLVASKPGFATESRALDLPAGKPITESITLEREKVQVRRENYERRWNWWLPWSLEGGAVALGLVGAGVYLHARTEIRQYDEGFAKMCPEGCPDSAIDPALKSKQSAARRDSGIAIGVWSAAGALVVTGAVMAIMNRPILREERATPTLTVSRDYVGIGLSLTLR